MKETNPGVEDITRLHAMVEANRQAEREALLNDKRARIKRINPLWPDEVRRTWLDLFGVVATYVCSALVWLAFARMFYAEVSVSVVREGGAVLFLTFAASNVRLLAEELVRQWRVR